MSNPEPLFDNSLFLPLTLPTRRGWVFITAVQSVGADFRFHVVWCNRAGGWNQCWLRPDLEHPRNILGAWGVGPTTGPPEEPHTDSTADREHQG